MIASRVRRATRHRAQALSRRAARPSSRPRSAALRARSRAESRRRSTLPGSSMPIRTPAPCNGFGETSGNERPAAAARGPDEREGAMEDEPRYPAGADRVDEREHPAQPEQTEHGFEQGQDVKPDTPEEDHVGTFAEGQALTPEAPDEEEIGRFSEGQEELPETPEKEVERRFSEGQEIDPETT